MTQPLALIIEDDAKLAAIFSYALRAVKFRTEIIKDGSTALARLEGTTPTVVVLDLHLPYVSGEEILTYIHTEAHLAQTKVIIATADAVLGDSLREESDLVLLKPISVTQLQNLAKRLRPVDATVGNEQ